MEETIEKVPDRYDMTAEEYDFIMKRAGITKNKLAKSARGLLSRDKDYSTSTIFSWLTYKNDKMKGFQIDLLYYSLEGFAFDSYRKQFITHKRELEERRQREIEARKKKN